MLVLCAEILVPVAAPVPGQHSQSAAMCQACGLFVMLMLMLMLLMMRRRMMMRRSLPPRRHQHSALIERLTRLWYTGLWLMSCSSCDPLLQGGASGVARAASSQLPGVTQTEGHHWKSSRGIRSCWAAAGGHAGRMCFQHGGSLQEGGPSDVWQVYMRLMKTSLSASACSGPE